MLIAVASNGRNTGEGVWIRYNGRGGCNDTHGASNGSSIDKAHCGKTHARSAPQ